MIVDGNNMIFGRLASQVAKKLMTGEEVHLINAEKIVIVGNPKQISQRYLTKRGIKHKGTPERSPVWSRIPHMLVKRMIRGMLPRETSRGRVALKKLRVYTGNPKNLAASGKVESAEYDGISKHITIKELCRSIGYSG
ncbi:MAG TPA: 50S ribosomal protein L13 [Candidatus Bilamarchaeum sp.]|nr:50S ribosomal protein L13 [Candidatus Bilamarchaeum sp.]